MSINGIYADAADRSNERADVARRILELSETIGEAIDHMLFKLDSFDSGVDEFADVLRDIGEGLISLEKGSKAISDYAGAGPEDAEALAYGYEDLSEKMDALVEAYLDDRPADFSILGGMLREAFADYWERLAQCFRGMSII